MKTTRISFAHLTGPFLIPLCLMSTAAADPYAWRGFETTSDRGTFYSDMDLVQFADARPQFISTMYVLTYSYGGGVQADGTAVPRGGFPTSTLVILSGDGDDDPLDYGGHGTACFARAAEAVPHIVGGATDPFTSAMLDSCLAYEVDPVNWETTWSAGLVQPPAYVAGGHVEVPPGTTTDGNGNFTFAYPECTQPNFCDPTGTPIYTNRTNGWAADVIVVPEIVCGREWYTGNGELGIQATGAHPAAMYESISEVCSTVDGQCEGVYDGVDITGWTWASIGDMGALFRQVSAHPGGVATYEGASDGDARTLIALLGYETGNADAIAWDGITRTPYGSAGLSGHRAAVRADLSRQGPDCISTDLGSATACQVAGNRVPLFRTAPNWALSLDADFDSIPDHIDNCMGPIDDANNPGQRDTDNDGFGNRCDPDFNNDNAVNFLDLVAIKAAFFATPGSANWNPHTDLDGNDIVDFEDLQTVKKLFFGRPGPSCTVF